MKYKYSNPLSKREIRKQGHNLLPLMKWEDKDEKPDGVRIKYRRNSKNQITCANVWVSKNDVNRESS